MILIMYDSFNKTTEAILLYYKSNPPNLEFNASYHVDFIIKVFSKLFTTPLQKTRKLPAIKTPLTSGCNGLGRPRTKLGAVFTLPCCKCVYRVIFTIAIDEVVLRFSAFCNPYDSECLNNSTNSTYLKCVIVHLLYEHCCPPL